MSTVRHQKNEVRFSLRAEFLCYLIEAGMKEDIKQGKMERNVGNIGMHAGWLRLRR
jgi:hypothetical protein